MAPHKISTEVFNAAEHYCRTGDKKLVERYTYKEIDYTLVEYFADKNSPEYNFLEKTSSELKEAEANERSKRETWKERGIGILIGIFVTVVGGIILYLIIKAS